MIIGRTWGTRGQGPYEERQQASANVREGRDNYNDMDWDGQSANWNAERCIRSAVLDSFRRRLVHKDFRAAGRPLQKFGEKLNFCNKIFR